MAFLRQYVAPLIAVIIFFVALAAVSARIFLPDDMAAPAPIEEVSPVNQHAQTPTLNVVGSGESSAIAN